MLLRFVGFAALAVLSSACTYRTQSPAHVAPVDYSDYAAYGQTFGDAPTRAPVAATSPSEGGFERQTATPAPRGAHLGFAADASPKSDSDSDSVTAEAEETEFEEVEAAPGSACYEAALKAGIQNGTCTLVSERKYVLVGNKPAL